MELIISYDEPEKTLYAELQPAEGENPVNPGVILEKLKDAGYQELNLDPQVVNKLCVAANNQEELKLPLKVLVDAKAEVQISSDKLKAYLTMNPADGGSDLTLDDIKALIEEAQVDAERVDWDAVKTAHEKGEAKELLIAKAIQPTKGVDALYSPLVESELDRAPEIDEQGNADMLSVHCFTLVDVGTQLMRKTPATAGEAGVNVLGEEIPATPGKDPGFAKNIEGAEISSDDENLLLASIKGHPLLLKNGVSVDSVLHVDEVSLNTGNIHFDGSLEVKGDVSAGMHIEVTGDVIVKGALERAVVIAGNNVVVRGGVFGDIDTAEIDRAIQSHHVSEELNDRFQELSTSQDESDENSETDKPTEPLIRAGGTVDVGFVNQAYVTAEKDIVVKQYAGNSWLEAGDSVLIGQNGGKGILFGGFAFARKRIAIAQLGNDTYLETLVQVGELEKLLRQSEVFAKVIKSRRKEAEQLSGILEKVKKNSPASIGQVTLDKAKRIANTIEAINKKVTELEQALTACRNSMDEQKHAHIQITKKIFPNGALRINGVSRFMHEEARADTWRLVGKSVMGDNEKAEE